ncbi:uncharacterized protein [Antedon mediterranea]|uniref:uncharacterized protein isoform X2 n=1 Tax=Antedon mediterranea TaxID=105859 RepID=UPI003AF83264
MNVIRNFDVGNQQYYLLAGQDGKSENENRISLTLTDGNSAWKGHLSQNDIKTLSEEVKMDLADFTAQTQSALFQRETKHIAFQYDVKDSVLDKVFSWKKVMAGGIKYQLGSIKLTAVDDTCTATQELYTFAISQMKILQDSIRTLEKENDRLSRERRKAVQLLEQCSTAKIDLENDLYSKFQVIVNDKKAKIRQLRENLKDSENKRERNQQQKTDQTTMEVDISDHEDKEEISTDDEFRLRDVELKQKTKKLKVDMVENDSLLLDDDDDELTTIQSSSRRRIRKTATKKVPDSGTSVILPTKTKQTTTRTPSSKAKTPQTRRNHSSRSNQSDPDTDDLLSEL